jgi:hypothetical protein
VIIISQERLFHEECWLVIYYYLSAALLILYVFLPKYWNTLFKSHKFDKHDSNHPDIRFIPTFGILVTTLAPIRENTTEWRRVINRACLVGQRVRMSVCVLFTEPLHIYGPNWQPQIILCCTAHWINSLFVVPVSGAPPGWNERLEMFNTGCAKIISYLGLSLRVIICDVTVLLRWQKYLPFLIFSDLVKMGVD